MRHSTQRWFEFAGRRSTEFGIRVLSAPTRPRAAERGSWISVPGRDGELFRPDGGRADIKLTFSLAAPADRLSAIAAWLAGPGYLISSDRPDAAWLARPVDSYVATPAAPGGSIYLFNVSFHTAHTAYIWPKQTLNFGAPGPVPNPGNATAHPVLHIAGSGSATLSLGGKLLVLSAIPTAITVDSAQRIAYSGTKLLTANLTGDWPIIPPGGSALSWTGGIQSVTLEPNYRVE